MIARVCARCFLVKEKGSTYYCKSKKEIGTQEVFTLSCDKFITKEEHDKEPRGRLKNAIGYIEDAINELSGQGFYSVEYPLDKALQKAEEKLRAYQIDNRRPL